MDLGFIVPIKYLEQFAVKSTYHLVLAHVVAVSWKYRDFYRSESKLNKIITLDNSSYELGDDLYTPEDLTGFALSVNATEVMAPEHYEDGKKTYEKVAAFKDTLRSIPKAAKLKIFATAHGKTLDEAFLCASKCIDLGVDTIGLSCRLNFFPYKTSVTTAAARLLSRKMLVEKLLVEKSSTSYHLLGLNDPRELYYYDERIRSNDSSSAFLNGLLEVDLLGEKNYKKPVEQLDFSFGEDLRNNQAWCIYRNIAYLKKLANCER